MRLGRVGGRTAIAVGTLATAALTGCGTSTGPALKDSAGSTPYRVAVTASFPERQQLSHSATMRITVKNEDRRAMPAAAVTVRGFDRTIEDVDNGLGQVRDPRRPIWVVDSPPAGAQTGYQDVYSLGKLEPGASRTFTWKLTPSFAGSFPLRWSVSGSVTERGSVQAVDGGSTSGVFNVKIASTPPDVTISPDDEIVPRDQR